MDMVDLAKSFMAGANASKRVQSQTVSGLAVSDSEDGRVTVQVAGTDVECACWPSVKEGQAVTVTVVNRRPVVTGVAGWGDAVDLRVASLAADIAYIRQAYIDELVAGSVTADRIAAAVAYLGTLEAKDVTAESIVAATGYVGELEATSVTTADLTAASAMVSELEAKDVTADMLVAASAYVGGLVADEITVGRLTAALASVDSLSATYAKIDWANVGVADIGSLLAKSGIIGEMTTESGTVTGTLVGVTIKGDLIKGGTVVADKLVMLGEDGLYYRLNTDGETVTGQQTDYNSLNGSHIQAQSVTADKISVTDLVAFGATIGGVVIGDGSLHSFGKETLQSPVSGFFLGSDGSMSLGDSDSYIRYDAGSHDLAIKVDELYIGSERATTEAALRSEISRSAAELSSTMEQDYAKKTDLSEVESNLSTQVTQNAGEIKQVAKAVTTANTAANNAAKKAQDAATAAANAQTTADTAKTNAANAQTAAANAKTAADNAQANANQAATAAANAQSKADQAATDLSAAEQNLADLQSRTDATEEDIAAAQAEVAKAQQAVKTAQTAADAAKSAAATAQSTADTAKTNAANAQTKADAAKQNAATAQAAANGAKAAADKAQADVDSLGVRVTKAETSITQNANAIALRATKEEVSNSIAGIQVGGTNLAIDSAKAVSNADYMVAEYHISANEGSVLSNGYGHLVAGRKYTVTVDATFPAGVEHLTLFSDWSTPMVELFTSGEGRQRISKTFMARYASGAGPTDNLKYATVRLFRFPDPGSTWPVTTTKVTIHTIKIEAGNMPTSWSPAPEDMATSAELQVTADAISGQVSSINDQQADMALTVNGLSVKVTNNFDDLTSGINTAQNDINKIQSMVRIGQDASGNALLALGTSASKLGVELTNQQLSFKDDNAVIAYVNGQILFIDRAKILSVLQVGRFGFVPRSNGNLSLKVVG